MVTGRTATLAGSGGRVVSGVRGAAAAGAGRGGPLARLDGCLGLELLPLLVGRPGRGEVVYRIVATIDGEPITTFELRRYAEERGAERLEERKLLDGLVTDRLLDRMAMREFEMRIAFQMSAADSSSLLDNPAATKLRQHRGLMASRSRHSLRRRR